jgi:hypothetical protein
MVSADGRPVLFVAKPESAPTDGVHAYSRPDDLSGNGKSWRDMLLDYNKSPGSNPLGLYPAYQLYENRVYGRLAEAVGLANLYILSAGWGLINAAFLTPDYDITFKPSAESYKRRRNEDRYRDYCLLPHQVDKEIVFLGGKDYVPLFCSLTSAIQSRKTVFYNSAFPPDARGCMLKKFLTSTRTNWHYECASALIDGRIILSQKDPRLTRDNADERKLHEL